MKAVDGRNNIKVYNLSAGKSLPDWLTERKRRKLAKRDIDIRRRIELIQDFNMPDVADTVKVSPDGQYIIATGTYKPRMKCFEVSALSQKFERCFDSEAIAFEFISDDYSKLVFLQEERYLEFHNQGGRWFRTRIPKFGRDMAYHYPSCDLYIGNSGSEIYRLNLQLGRFQNSLQTDSLSINKCVFNPVHYLFTCGSSDGYVEAWDPRSRHRVGILDCTLHMLHENIPLPTYKSVKDLGVTALAYNDALTLGVGTKTGQVLLYDIRSNKPMLVKDHMDGLPIIDLEFHKASGMILSMSPNVVKIWDQNSGKPHTSIESDVKYNDLCTIPDSGMILMAAEDAKMQVYFLPTLGPAPKWCGHLDALIEELEEEDVAPTFDDYKFVTEEELKQLGLDNLIGSNVLRAVMHGYYMDIRLYNKAKLITNPTDYEDSIKRKVKQKISEQNERKIIKNKVTSKAAVNKESYVRLQEDASAIGDAQAPAKTILEDERFSALFSRQEFAMDKTSEMFNIAKPLVKSKEKYRHRESDSEDEQTTRKNKQQMTYLDPDPASDSDSIISNDGAEEELEEPEPEPVKKKKEKKKTMKSSQRSKVGKSVLSDFREADSVNELQDNYVDMTKMTLAERLAADEAHEIAVKDSGSGSKEMAFSIGRPEKFKQLRERQRDHHNERKKLMRSTAKLKGSKLFNKPNF